MNAEMAYLLGMVCGNGEIQRRNTDTTIAISIPHKVTKTDDFHDIALYVKASLDNIRKNIEPLVGTGINTTQSKSVTCLSFTKPNSDYLVREIGRYVGNAVSHDNMRIHEDIFGFSVDERKMFLRGIADVTGYIRRSNYHITAKYAHRVYIEVPHNWALVIDVCNLLKSVDIPVQAIDWAHPNTRDGRLTKYNQGKKNFWKKEHQIKIWANEFLPIGFGILHKQQALENLSREFASGYRGEMPFVSHTHRYYWQMRCVKKTRPRHPCEGDSIIPAAICGKHFDSWQQIAKELGYDEDDKR